MADAQEIYKSYVKALDRRRRPIPGRIDFGLPVGNADLAAAKEVLVAPAPDFRFSAFDPRPVETNKKLETMAGEFAGQPEFLLLHAYLISHMRKKTHPPLAQRLFVRMWKEEAEYLVSQLNPRWLLSAIISFSTCGLNERQRTAGVAFNMFFSLLKLSESERLYSGLPADQPFSLNQRIAAPMPLGMSPYSMQFGDLDVNTLALLYEIGTRDSVTAVPCRAFLNLFIEDPGTVFARLVAMKYEA